ncbi:ATP-binding protein, partial [bacterium]|nr:ATP-binding protein [bacterium]
IYGDEGIGKSTLATQFPAPLVLDTEDGTHHLDVARVSVHDWKTLTLAVTELAVNPQGFQTIVIDSADWAEKLLIEWLLKTSGKKSIEDFGFGRGYTMLAEHWTRFLASCDVLVSHGINVVWVAHSCVKRVSPPDQTDGYDRYELKLTKQVSPLLREWCDLLLFCTYKMKLVEGGDGRLKAQGGKERVMHAEHSAAWSAKNRFGLPAEMPMDIGQLESIFAGPAPAPVGAPGQPAKTANAVQGPAAGSEETLQDLIERHIADAKSVRTLGKIGDRIDALLSEGQLTEDQADVLTKAVAARHDELKPKEVANVVV